MEALGALALWYLTTNELLYLNVGAAEEVDPPVISGMLDVPMFTVVSKIVTPSISRTTLWSFVVE